MPVTVRGCLPDERETDKVTAANVKKAGNAQLAVPYLFQHLFPSWFTGIAFSAIVIGALVPAAIMAIAAANLFTRNIFKEFFKPGASPRLETRVSQWVSLIVKVEHGRSGGRAGAWRRRPAQGHRAGSWPSWPDATRPRLAPRWNPASRSLAVSADLTGPKASGRGLPIAPGTRFARGARTGRPAVVRPPEAGARTVLAASQPVSAGASQPPPAAVAPPDGLRRLLNQSDSTAS
jgi:hypothetical protein